MSLHSHKNINNYVYGRHHDCASEVDFNDQKYVTVHIK